MGRPVQSFRKGSSLSIILDLLKESGKTMTVSEITKLVLEKKSLSSKTPERTISAVLQRSKRVKKVSKATYAINEEFQILTIKTKKDVLQEFLVKRDDLEKTNTIHGLVIKILKKNKDPLSMDEIAEYILKNKKLDTKTPKNTIRGVLLRSKFIKKNIYAKYELIDQSVISKIFYKNLLKISTKIIP